MKKLLLVFFGIPMLLAIQLMNDIAIAQSSNTSIMIDVSIANTQYIKKEFSVSWNPPTVVLIENERS